MYSTLKKLLPTKFLKRYEGLFRPLVSFAYRGSAYRCTICDFKMSRFVALDDGGLLCPSCGSLGRTRRLWTLIKPQIGGKKILHFSPPRALRNKLSQRDDIDYITTDYADEFAATKRLDITNIDEPNDTYDLIICYHVLEHIIDDTQAMRELHRITKPGGRCIIQTPFRQGEILEDLSITAASDRLLHYGQRDHVRIYSPESLEQRLIGAGFRTEVLRYTADVGDIYGYKLQDIIIYADKTA